MTTPTVVYDFEFYFINGQLLCLTAEEGRDRITADDARVRLELHSSPGVIEEIIVARSTLAYMRTTKRELARDEQPEDAGRLRVVGGLDAV